MKYNELLEKYKILEEENRILKEEIKQLKMKSVAEPPYTGIKRCQEPRPVDNLGLVFKACYLGFNVLSVMTKTVTVNWLMTSVIWKIYW